MITMEDMKELIAEKRIIYEASCDGYAVIDLGSVCYDYAYDNEMLYEINKKTREMMSFYRYYELFVNDDDAKQRFWEI